MKFRLEKRRENDAIFAQYVLISVAYVLTCYVWVKLSNSICHTINVCEDTLLGPAKFT